MKKCPPDEVDNCWYCTINPPRLLADIYGDLHFVPDPVLQKSDSSKFKDFSEVYGQPTDDSCRPSLSSKAATKSTKDAQLKHLLAGPRVRSFIRCSECEKPHCIYSAAKLGQKDWQVVKAVKEEGVYTCGSPLFPDSSCYSTTIVVREGLSCVSLMETTYYATNKTVHFPLNVCFHCGSIGDMANDDEIQELHRKYSVVRPICTDCKACGKEVVVRAAKNLNKKRKVL